jgi:phosphoglycerol transferase MdoB-like AlkP superfamily enzyme
MENPQKNILADNSLFSNSEMIEYLRETAKWGKFLAIVGYIGMGFMVLGGLFFMLGMSQLNIPNMESSMMGIGVVYLCLGALYYFPVTYLYNFSVKMTQGINSEDTNTFVDGFQNLKSLFKFMGIFTIVILSLYGLILLGVMVGAAVS